MRLFTNPWHGCAPRRLLVRVSFLLLSFGASACSTDAVTPTIALTAPADAATGVALSTTVSAVFNTAMAPLSTSTLTLMQGSTAVAGTVTNSADGMTATFTPTSSLAGSSVFTATVTSSATSSAGTALAANKSWTFTTTSALNAAQAPALSATSPADAAASVAIDASLAAVFDRPMAALSATTFKLQQGTASVAGSITMSADGTTAFFTPSSNLAAGASFTATITAAAASAVGTAFGVDSAWSFTTATNYATQAPTLISTSPASIDPNVAVNARLSVVFTLPMNPLTTTTFTLHQGTTPVLGTVSTSDDGAAAMFTPNSSLDPNTAYTATITAGATSTEGVALAADTSWTFTTGTVSDTTAPVVSGTHPNGGDTGVSLNTKVAVTFSEAMDPVAFTASSFTVKHGTSTVAGSISYGPGSTATFTPTSALTPETLFTATLNPNIKDLAGNALADYTWSFTTGMTAAKGPAPVLLGAAGNYAVLAKAAISTVPASTITGDIGVSPAAATYMTGFSLVADATNVFSTSPQIVGKAYAADYAVPTPSNLTTAVSNMEAAYTDAASRPTPNFLELGTGNIGGKTLAPGLYKWTSTVTIPADVVIFGGAKDVWIFQTTGDLSMSAAKRVTLGGGALAKNIFWQVAGKATFGAGSHFEGILLCKTEVTAQTGATMNGRILAQTQVALQQATITQPAQ